MLPTGLVANGIPIREPCKARSMTTCQDEMNRPEPACGQLNKTMAGTMYTTQSLTKGAGGSDGVHIA